MKKSDYIRKSFFFALGVAAYVLTISLILQATKDFPNEPPSLLVPVVMLLLFIVSATITALLVLGKPIHLYMSGLKREAFLMLCATLGWLILFLILGALGILLLQ